MPNRYSLKLVLHSKCDPNPESYFDDDVTTICDIGVQKSDVLVALTNVLYLPRELLDIVMVFAFELDLALEQWLTVRIFTPELCCTTEIKSMSILSPQTADENKKKHLKRLPAHINLGTAPHIPIEISCNSSLVNGCYSNVPYDEFDPTVLALIGFKDVA
jgi:hypothetical protein